ncbi:carbamoyltransferase C-terminal domain-containing protein [Plantactinospora sp. KBS50]|uniref:carbamoyltransferase C-terminal domain-containing protein n=1 Tax=Plantactinospora sp. KBS50 TaxID=2024580 RepID=UPI0012FD7E8F|nr:carbamoyltransferase C-terminal domain-containing protein [Plantactinospora sp. KBS50]
MNRYGLGQVSRQVTPADIANLIAGGSIVCWFDGASEWGPRALGGRSILADPLRDGVVVELNRRVKFREPFRPFGLSVAEDALAELIDIAQAPATLAPYMLAVGRIRDDRLSAIVHRDGTVRYQSVTCDYGPYHQLLMALRNRIGLAAVLNTSFNTMGEPLVETPDDAVRQFLLCGADALYLDGALVEADDLPLDTLAAAREQAWSGRGVDLLRLALQQEAAGYPDAAQETATRLTPCRSDGPGRIRESAALMMRLAELAGADETAVERAEEVLQWSGLPPAAGDAARLLTEVSAQGRAIGPDAARFLAAIAPPGRASAIVARMLS